MISSATARMPKADRPVRSACTRPSTTAPGLTAGHYENFSVVTWLTPRQLRPAFQSIYAFCRWSDDLGDEVGDPARSKELLGWWRGELRAMYEGETRHPVMVALAATVEEFAIPIEPFEALISAFEQDQIVTEYADYDQLLDYCSRSANPVGHLVLYLARSYDVDNAGLSDLTCTGLQLANFWQDVGRDLAIGRIYLPLEDRRAFGYRDEDLKAQRFTPAFADLLRFEVGRARDLLQAGRLLIERMPRALAVDVDLFSRGGLAILDRIEARGFDVLTSRPEVGKLAKLGLLARAMLARRPTQAFPNPGREGLVNELQASYDFCVDLSRREARNFYYSFLVLPGERRRSMCALYAFLRRTDDLADAPGPVEPKAPAIEAWRRDLDKALVGNFNTWPGLLALADSVRKHEIPLQYLHEVIDGVEMDLVPRSFATFEDLTVYCYRVASVVGLSCLHIWGYRSDGGKAEALAESCGVALQLTNIIRDVREDALQGRVYLPMDDLRRFGVDPAELAAPRPTGRVRALLEYQGARAYDYYRRAEPLVTTGRPGGPSGPPGDGRDLPGAPRRDRPARLRRPQRPGRPAVLAEAGHHRPVARGEVREIPSRCRACTDARPHPRGVGPVRMSPPTTRHRAPHVAIVGGGLAGLAVAASLVDRGVRVTLFESRPRLGGRASSFQDPATGEMVDNCQHVSMACCTNLADFCRKVGVADLLPPGARGACSSARRGKFRGWPPADCPPRCTCPGAS